VASGLAPQGNRRGRAKALRRRQRLRALLLIGLGVVLVVLPRAAKTLLHDSLGLLVDFLRDPVTLLRLAGLLLIAVGVLLLLRLGALLKWIWKSFELLIPILIPLGVLLIGLLLLRTIVQGRPVTAEFSRVGGATRVETAVEASRFWLTPPQIVAITWTDAHREIMWGAAHCAMVHDAPLLFVRSDRNRQRLTPRDRQRLVERAIENWSKDIGFGKSPQPKLVGDKDDVDHCVANGQRSDADGLSVLEVPDQQLELPLVKAQKELASTVVFAVAKTQDDPPDVAVALALAAHMARRDRQVSLVVVPRYLEADPELEKELRDRRELIKGGVVLGQTGILSEDTRALLRQVLTSTDQTTFLGELRTTLGSLTPVITALLALFTARAAAQAAPKLARQLTEGRSIMVQAWQGRPRRDRGPTTSTETKETKATAADWISPLPPSRQSTVWLHSGWRVTGIIEQGKDGADVPTGPVLRLNDATLTRDGDESKQMAEFVLVPVNDIELIGVAVRDQPTTVAAVPAVGEADHESPTGT
jgi:hypothetical protein